MSKISSLNNSDFAICAKNNAGPKDNSSFSQIFDSVARPPQKNNEKTLNSDVEKQRTKHSDKNHNLKSSENKTPTTNRNLNQAEAQTQEKQDQLNRSKEIDVHASLKKDEEILNEFNVQLLLNSIFNVYKSENPSLSNSTDTKQPFDITRITTFSPQEKAQLFDSLKNIPTEQLDEFFSKLATTVHSPLTLGAHNAQNLKQNLSENIVTFLQKSTLSEKQISDLSDNLTSIFVNKIDSLQNNSAEFFLEFAAGAKLQELLTEFDSTDNTSTFPDFINNSILQDFKTINTQTNNIPQTLISPEQQLKLNAQIELHVRNNLNNTQETILHLNPKNLGAASIQIQWNNVDQSASLHLVLEKPQSLAAVQEALNGLKESLGQQGIKITEIKSTIDASAGNFNFSQNDSQQNQRQEFLFNQQNKNGFNYEKTNPGALPENNATNTHTPKELHNQNNILNISI